MEDLSEFCSHLHEFDIEILEKLVKQIKTVEFSLFCYQCEKPNKKSEKNIQEPVYICLHCLNVGCIAEKKGHAKKHFKDEKNHPLAVTPRGEIFCYKCDTIITNVKEKDKQKLGQLQKIIKDLISDKGMKSIQHEEEKFSKFQNFKNCDTEKGFFDDINFDLYKKNNEESQKFSNIVGLSNLGNTCIFAYCIKKK